MPMLRGSLFSPRPTQDKISLLDAAWNGLSHLFKTDERNTDSPKLDEDNVSSTDPKEKLPH